MVKEPDSQDVSPRQPAAPAAPAKTKSYRALWIVILVFAAFVATIFLTHKEETVNWVQDYQTGLKLAQEQKKPVLLAFYKQFTRFTTDTFENTYNSPKVIEFVETNFIPILINVDEQPKIAEQYKVAYYPTHYIKRPDSNDLFGPLVGYDPPDRFIKELKNLIKKMESSGK
ncbi:MAG TPA: DUF255 domain-containing protein [Sedimentisphaerales bacterium]|nr:DUF255 domain-containing protein [Sedimentisphaerales bacterium]